MTLLPAGVKVHLAFGYIDMRKAINGLAMLVQGVLRQIPSRAISSCSGGGRPISSRSSIGMAPASASSPSGLSTASSSGRRTSTELGR
jgi:hypothetical protein